LNLPAGFVGHHHALQTSVKRAMSEAPTSGHRADTRQPFPRGFSFLLSSLLFASATPAFAGPMLAADSAEAMPTGSASLALSENTAAVPKSPSVLFASDVNHMIAAQANEPEPESRVQTVLKRALALLGTPYRWGGESPDGFDCSGLVGYVFRTALGIELPRVSRELAINGEQVERAALTAGDLVFFSRRGKRVDHVGIYVGNGQFVHAPRRGRDVTVSSLADGYWSRKFMQARRVPGV
jgi:cell wall-associated NlpC family hydrolase